MKRRIISICLVLGSLALAVFILAVEIANAQSVTPTPTPGCDSLTFTGHVYDAATGLGISGATVGASLDVPRTFSTTTDASGAYSLTVPMGYGCHVTGLGAGAAGYDSLSKGRPLVNPVDFSLTKSGVPTATVTITRTSLPGCSTVVIVTSTPSPTFTPTFTPTVTRTVTRTPTTCSPIYITATPGGPTLTPTRTPTGPTPTRTRTPTTGPSLTPSRTPTFTTTTGPTLCSPTSTITAPFTFDGAGTFCWQSNNLGTYINSWNLTSLTINLYDYTNLYVAAASYPAKINGNWYISYTSAVSYGHFEAK
jgi:hypothetical protein